MKNITSKKLAITQLAIARICLNTIAAGMYGRSYLQTQLCNDV